VASVSSVIVVVVVVVVRVASLSSVEFEDLTTLDDFLNSSICRDETDAPAVGLGPVMGARPEGVSARMVKCEVHGGPSGAARAS